MQAYTHLGHNSRQGPDGASRLSAAAAVAGAVAAPGAPVLCPQIHTSKLVSEDRRKDLCLVSIGTHVQDIWRQVCSKRSGAAAVLGLLSHDKAVGWALLLLLLSSRGLF